MKNTLHIVVLIASLIATILLAYAWRSARKDTNQLNSTLATQNVAIQQAQTREKQQNAQLTAALDAMAAQKRAVQTPQQAAKAIPSVLPPLPLPVSIQIPAMNSVKPDNTLPATITVPQADLKPLYDDLQDCRMSKLQANAAKQELADEQARSAALTRERDAAITVARGGTFWARLRRGAKWFVIGAAVGAAASAAARH